MDIDLNDYFYFAHVVEKGGFAAAGRALSLPKSLLSRHVQQLDARGRFEKPGFHRHDTCGLEAASSIPGQVA